MNGIFDKFWDKKDVVCLVGCGKAKLPYAAPAKKLYVGTLTKMSIVWADRNCNRFGILSAKYGLLGPDQKVETYNLRISDLGTTERIQWGKEVAAASKLWRVNTPCIVLAGSDYTKALPFPFVDLLKGLALFQRMTWLKNNPRLLNNMLEIK